VLVDFANREGDTEMANELNWLRSKARHLQTEMMIVTPNEAETAECQPGTYQIERFGFSGTIPVRMAKALQGCTDLIKTDAKNEVLHLGNGYVSGQGQCRYYRTTYTLIS
jgi:hypothetical protein